VISQKPKTTVELRKFGGVMTVACGLLGSLLMWRSRPAGPYVVGLSALFLLLAAAAPGLLAPVERAWMKMAEVIAAVMTRVILTLTFFLVITPVGIVRRLMGYDSLGLRIDRSAPTYWAPVEPDGPCSRPDKPY
jgi:hypothetical protein